MDTSDNAPEFIGPAEAAAILMVSPKTITRWAVMGLIPTAVTTLGGHRRFRRADIEAIRTRMEPSSQPGVSPRSYKPSEG